MFENKSKDWQQQNQQLARKGISRLCSENEVYKIICSYLKNQKMEFHIEFKKTIQFYTASISPSELRNNLSTYDNMETLFQYLQADPTKLTFHHVRKYLLIQDYVGKRPKFTKFQVKQKVLDTIEFNEIKLQRTEKKVVNLQSQLKNAKSQITQLKQQISIQQGKELHLIKEIQDLKQLLKKAEKRYVQSQSQFQRLESILLLKEKNDEEDQNLLNTIQKRHKYNEINLSHDIKRRKPQNVRKILRKPQKYYEQSTSNSPLEQTERQKPRLNEETPINHSIYGEKLKVTASDQRNSHKYEFDGNYITKIFGEKKGHIYFFETEEKLFKMTSSCWLSIKNMSPVQLKSLNSLYILTQQKKMPTKESSGQEFNSLLHLKVIQSLRWS